MNSPTPEPQEIILNPNAEIPGLLPADVTINLEDRGLTCSKAEQGQSYFIRECKGDESGALSIYVLIYGTNLLSVDFIETTVFQFIDPIYELASPILGFMATMPYTDSQPAAARLWVETELLKFQESSEVSTTIAGVKYRLSGISTAITLEMGELK